MACRPPSRLGAHAERRYGGQPSRGLPSEARSAYWGPPSRRVRFRATLWWASFACIHERRMVDRNSGSWNQLEGWLRQLNGLRELSRLSCAGTPIVPARRHATYPTAPSATQSAAGRACQLLQCGISRDEDIGFTGHRLRHDPLIVCVGDLEVQVFRRVSSRRLDRAAGPRSRRWRSWRALA